MAKYDIVLLTDSRYLGPKPGDPYTENVLTEDGLVQQALEKRGLKVYRTNWDDEHFDWSETDYAMFRTTWDYFDRFGEFSQWLENVSSQTKLINPIELIKWNLDKHYLKDLQDQGIPIPPTRFIEPGEIHTLTELALQTGWTDLILKPAVSGAARHTYKLNAENLQDHEDIFKELIAEESLLLQEFQHSIFSRGEVAFMVFNGKFTHAILKKGKKGDFRVQDDFGGTVHDYTPTHEEVKFAESVVSVCSPLPAYARVDVIWDNRDNIVVSELELIEPELWFRNHPMAAELLAESISDGLS